MQDKEMKNKTELEKQFGFKYLSRNTFENRRDIRARGLKHPIPPEAIEFGKQYIDQIKCAYIPEVSIRFVGEKVGHGLFAEEKIKAGDYVGEYTGHVRKNTRLFFAPLSNYCYEYPVPDSIGRSFVIDATDGCLTRFINHSYHPNLRPVYAFHRGFYHLIFIALSDIEIGTELSYNYGVNYWYVREPPFQDLTLRR